MLLGVVCLEKGKELKASATLQGDGGKIARSKCILLSFLHELYTCSLKSPGCIDRAKCCLFALLSVKVQMRDQAFSVSLPALSTGIVY